MLVLPALYCLPILQSHVVLALFIGSVGVLYWFICFHWIPYKKGYRLAQEVVTEDGFSYKAFRRISDSD